MRCPYCKEIFDEKYYLRWHVPCPSPFGDNSKEKEKRK